MDVTQLKQFLIDANKAGYATGKEDMWTKEADNSTTITFEKDGFRMIDNFYGGEPYGGRMTVFYEEKPVWIMVYYGWVVEGNEFGPVYEVLQHALAKMPADSPLRGPHSYTEGEFEYINFWEGDMVRFMGEEQIVKGEDSVYKATYVGGLVDIVKE
ncbi:hypothetical protein COX05_01425 [candidate division WWE3 bacterium CG22_combo_CG10-13_8_21_14_all_39_12]|uniref:DUF5680 domain-containing protein n=2 Tax=Katanobacteria TaxID=422282 RepID=A0A2M7X458_UNCKA|nr:MAG: hypothetical protein COX05_01425 [candidate division WWE3 bacterium CG22_combo_CG10-13_8_21_14_all_39_12]PJA40927.1 MAG: hypothetical protein CO179_00970 [candidate division WWE3 bacterium CG_4_9_14_3_um_filter_39_7]